MTLEHIKLHDGTLPAYAWPGGYPIIYITHDGDTLCAACAEPGAIAYAIHWEGPPEHCADCNAVIESAYGEPDA